MSRLTEKLKNGNYICGIIKGGFVDKLGKLEDLEEEIGCPLEVYVGISQQNITKVYDEYGMEYIILKVIRDQFNACNFMNGLNNTLVCEWKDYKKTWWLKKDKSE